MNHGWIETIKYSKGKIPLLEYHIQRLQQGLFASDIYISEKNIQSLIVQAIGDFHLNQQEIYRLRLIFEFKENLKITDIQYTEWPDELFVTNIQGYSLTTFKSNKHQKTDSSKSTERGLYIEAAEFAKEKNCNDAIILNQSNHLSDTSIFNIWLLKNEKLYTPPLSDGCVMGVFRTFLLRESPFTIIEKAICIEDAKNADAILLSNALRGMQWVHQWEEKRFQQPEIANTINTFANAKLVDKLF